MSEKQVSSDSVLVLVKSCEMTPTHDPVLLLSRERIFFSHAVPVLGQWRMHLTHFQYLYWVTASELTPTHDRVLLLSSEPTVFSHSVPVLGQWGMRLMPESGNNGLCDPLLELRRRVLGQWRMHLTKYQY